MALKRLKEFQYFALEDFLADKTLVFLKAEQWREGQGSDATIEGAKVVTQILEDKTEYAKEDVSNFGEQITVKVRGMAPTAYSKLKPLNTEVVITDVEKASIFGDFSNQLSVIAVVNVKGGAQ